MNSSTRIYPCWAFVLSWCRSHTVHMQLLWQCTVSPRCTMAFSDLSSAQILSCSQPHLLGVNIMPIRKNAHHCRSKQWEDTYSVLIWWITNSCLRNKEWQIKCVSFNIVHAVGDVFNTVYWRPTFVHWLVYTKIIQHQMVWWSVKWKECQRTY
jgi:hypothetical protein